MDECLFMPGSLFSGWKPCRGVLSADGFLHCLDGDTLVWCRAGAHALQLSGARLQRRLPTYTLAELSPVIRTTAQTP